MRAKLLLEEAFSERSKGNLDISLEKFQQYSRDHRMSEKLHQVMGGILWELNRGSEAAMHFRKAVELSPESEDSSLLLFNLLWEMGEEERATAEIRRFMTVSHSEEYVKIIKALHTAQVRGE